MGSPSSATLDEVHCLWPLCSHTCCWEAEQRIHTGKPRMLKALTSCRASAAAADDDRFPAVTVVNAVDWTNAGSSIEDFSLKSEDNVLKAATNAHISQVSSPRGARRQKNVQIPNSSLATSAHLETHREKKTVKLRTIQISPLPSMSQSSKAVMMWVPSPCYVPHHDSQLSVKSPRLAVKNLIFLPSAEMNKSIEIKKKLKQDKARKRVPLKKTSLKSQLNQEGKGSLKSEVDTDLSDPGRSWPGPHSDLQVEKVFASPQCHNLVLVGQTLAATPDAKDDQQPPRSARTLRPRNNPVVLQPVCERMQRRHTRDEHRTSKHKLDMKSGIERIDWESLKRQTYLWRRHTLAADSESSSLEDQSDHVPDSLHPVTIPSSYYQSKNPPITGAAKCQNKDYGIWQGCSRFLPSKYKGGPLRNDDFKFWFSTYCYWNPVQHAINADDQSDMELCIKGANPPPNSKQSSLVSSAVELTRNI